MCAVVDGTTVLRTWAARPRRHGRLLVVARTPDAVGGAIPAGLVPPEFSSERVALLKLRQDCGGQQTIREIAQSGAACRLRTCGGGVTRG